jgi:hypothetical protein
MAAPAGAAGTNGSPQPGPAPAAAAARTGAAPDASPAAQTTAANGSPADAKQAGAPDLGRRVTVVPGIARYHSADCILIRFLGEDDLETMTLGKAEESGCVPCRACRPEKELATAL